MSLFNITALTLSFAVFLVSCPAHAKHRDSAPQVRATLATS